MNVAHRQRPAPGELFLDHVAHFVPDLDAAARVLEKLGLSVTPASAQAVEGKPAGTSNRTVMLEEGYLEILAPTTKPPLDTPNAARVREYTSRFVGVHLACFGTPDAESEHRRLAAHGFEPPPLVELSRRLDDGAEVRFKVVRAGDKMPEGRVQYVEHLAPEVIWRDAFVNPLKLAAVLVVADDAVAVAARWARFAGLIPYADADGVRLDTARGSVLVRKRYPWRTPPGPAIAGYALAASHPERLLARCSAAGLAPKAYANGDAVELPGELGGAWLITARR
ncbi:MAG: VOC family protein [Betaproteobacteria bacterium]